MMPRRRLKAKRHHPQVKKVSEGCLNLNIPVITMQEYLHLGPDETLDLAGVNHRQGDDPETNTERVKIVAQMTGTFVSLALRSSAMGTIFQRKINGIWNCELETPSTQTTEWTSATSTDRAKTQREFESSAYEDAHGSIYNPDVKDSSIARDCPVERTQSPNTENINELEGRAAVADVNLGSTPLFLSSLGAYVMDATMATDTNSVAGNKMEEALVGIDMDLKDIFVKADPDGCAEIRSIVPQTQSDNVGNHTKKKRIKREKTHTCPLCSRGYADSKKLNYHIRMKHKDTKPFLCPTCGEGYRTPCQLRIHTRTHQERKTFLCDTCGKKFLTKGGYKQHIRDHSGEKPFQCTVCGQSFSRKGYWQEHIRIHTGDKRYTCTICGSSFIRSTHLQRHVRTHTGERPYKCELCDKRFATPSYRAVHMTIHTGLKKYICSTCGKAFNSSTPLKRHLRIHTGEKPYACSVCGKRFNQTSSRFLHMRIHTGEKPFVCPVCGDKYSQKNSLNAHMKMHIIADNANL